MSLLEQNTTKRRQVNKLLKLELEQEPNVEDDKKYEIKKIYNNKIYVKEVVSKLLGIYYYVFWKS